MGLPWGLLGLFGQGPRRPLHVWPPVKSATGRPGLTKMGKLRLFVERNVDTVDIVWAYEL